MYFLFFCVLQQDAVHEHFMVDFECSPHVLFIALFQLWSDIISFHAVAYPTGSVNGILTSGDIKAGITGPPGRAGVLSPLGLVGPLIGKNITALDNIVKSKNAYVTVRTVDHQRGEIQGQILPTNTNVNCFTTQRFAPPSTEPSANNTRY